MAKNLFLPLLFLILFSFTISIYAQNIGGIINSYAKVSSISGTTLTVSNISGSIADFAPGNKVMVIQMKGADINRSNTSDYGSINDLNEAGNFEYAIVDKLTGAGTVYTLTLHHLTRPYDVSGYVQIISVPQYDDVTTSADVSALPWNNASGTGGVLVLEVAGTLTLAANFDVSGKGFAGGSVNPTPNGNGTDLTNYVTTSTILGQKGEGIAAYGAEGWYGMGALGSGGGGGNTHNAGGGGGGNFSAGGFGGDSHYGSGGNGNPGKQIISAPAENKIFMGGGGGGGQENNSNASPGGAGGGIIIVRARQLTSDCGPRSIRANGANAVNTTGNDGGGGGGAGGTIMLEVGSFDLTCNIEVSTNGGNGGNVTTSQKHAGGGGGGAGAILLPGSTSSIYTNISSNPGTPGLDCSSGTCTSAGSSGAPCSGDACDGDDSWPLLPNSSPIAYDDVVTIAKGATITIAVLENDRDADFGSLFTVSATSTTVNGTISLSGDNFIYTPNAGFTGSDSFDYQICDNGSPVLCNTATVSITVNTILLSSIESSPVMFTEGQPPLMLTGLLSVNHVDNTTLTGAIVEISDNYLPAEDLLAFTNGSEITGSWDTGTGRLTLSGTASVADYQAALRTVTYQNTNSNNPSAATRTVNFTVSDGSLNSNVLTRDIEITPVNDAPVLAGIEATALAVTEGDAAKIVTASISSTDVDNTNFNSASIQISANYLASEDVLAFTSANGITGSWNSVTGTLSLSGAASVAHYQAAFRSITYQNTNSNNPSAATRTVSFTVSDGSLSSNIVTRDVEITPINDAPVLAGIEATALAVTEGDAAKIISASISSADVDNANLNSASVQISANYLATEDVLAFTDANGITGSWNSVTGTLSLSGTASVAHYQAALRSITYQNTNSNNPSAATRTVRFTVSDGSLSSNIVTRNIEITPVNDAPILSGMEATALVVTEGDAAKIISSSISSADVDNASFHSASIQISTNYLATEDVLAFTDANGITGSWNAATGTLSLSGTASVAHYQSALRSIIYQNTNGNNPSAATRTVSITVSDGLVSSNTVTRDINVIPVNDVPTLAAIESVALSFTEGDAATAVTATIAIDDVDNTDISGATITISANYVNSEDVLAFTNANGITGSWNATTGTLTLSGTATIAHYQTALRSVTYHNTNGNNPSGNTRTVSFMSNDGQLDSNILTRDIDVLPVNDAPVLAAIESSALSFTEGDAAKAISGALTVNDADNVNIAGAILQITVNYLATEDVLAFTNASGITGTWNATAGILTLSGNATLAQYQAALRSATYKNTNIDNPSGAGRTVSITINDGALNSNTLSRAVSLTPVNDAPQIALLETSAILFTEGDPATFISGTITTADVDNTHLARAEIQIISNYLATEDVLTFSNANGITGSWDATSGKLTLTGSASVAAYQTALRAVSYQNMNDEKPSILTRTISLSVNDGGLKSNVLTRDIEIIPINDAPVTADDIAVTDKNVPVVINVLGNDFDVEGNALAVSSNALTAPLNGSLVLNADQTFTYTPNFNFFGTDSFVYMVCDDGDPMACSAALVSITINYKNYSPVAENDLIDILEDETIIIEVLANDADPDLDEINVSLKTVSPPKFGKVVLNGNKYTYTPNPNYNGNDAFKYEICDNGTPSICATALVDIYIEPVNDAPEPSDDKYTNKDVIAEIKGNVLDNDYDIEADMLSVDLNTLILPEHGQLSIKADGSFSYLPNPGFFGQDTFNYFACDDGNPSLCSQATVVLRISSGVPKGFSPNGDNINDEWIITGLEEFPMNNVVVLNRYGDIVFEIKGYDNSSRVWRGEVNRGIKLGSGDLPDGTYFYVIDFGDGQSTEKGFVMIKR